MTFDAARPKTWPVWMRVAQIVSSPTYQGPYPATRWHWDHAVREGRAPKPKKFSSRVVAWHRDDVARFCGLPVPSEDKAATAEDIAP